MNIKRAVRSFTFTVTTITTAAALIPAVAGAQPTTPSGLSQAAVRNDLRHLANGFKAFVGRGHCHGSESIQHCIVKGSISDDNVYARVTLHAGSPIRYTDKLSLTAGMGGGTVTRTLRGHL